jgi:hypothetical protein
MKGLVNIPDKQLGDPLEQKATPANVDVLGLKAKIVVIKTLHLLGILNRNLWSPRKISR